MQDSNYLRRLSFKRVLDILMFSCEESNCNLKSYCLFNSAVKAVTASTATFFSSFSLISLERKACFDNDEAIVEVKEKRSFEKGCLLFYFSSK